MGPQGIVFRDTAVVRDGAALLAEVAEDLSATGGDPEARLVAPLLSAAALEGALDDAGAASSAARRLTDRIASAYWQRDARALPDAALVGPLPRGLRVPRPEGFAYYALDPRAMGEVARQVVTPVTVVGIRTIGVALSAVAAAALGDADRFTVRPDGPPYDRVTALSAEQEAHVRARAAAGARFLVVDEGPGLSGSSFLATAEALVAAGASCERVVLLGTRPVDPTTLVARDAAVRWRRFRSLFVPAAEGDLSAGAWRGLFWPDPARWPASWTSLERRKKRAGDWLEKFEGLGRHGAAVHARAEALAREGWGVPPAGPPDGRGLVAYPFPAGRPLAAGDRSPALLRAMGRAAAARVRLFPAEPDPAALGAMVRANVSFAGGDPLPEGWQLPCERPVIADGRMMPHEWLRTRDGHLIKADGAAHGDDHLYPGPVDVAWDLAGAAIEWELDGAEIGAMVAAYRAAAGDDPAPRLPAHLLAYAAFRACASAMAAHGADGDEAARLLRDRDRYRRAVIRLGRA